MIELKVIYLFNCISINKLNSQKFLKICRIIIYQSYLIERICRIKKYRRIFLLDNSLRSSIYIDGNSGHEFFHAWHTCPAVHRV